MGHPEGAIPENLVIIASRVPELKANKQTYIDLHEDRHVNKVDMLV